MQASRSDLQESDGIHGLRFYAEQGCEQEQQQPLIPQAGISLENQDEEAASILGISPRVFLWFFSAAMVIFAILIGLSIVVVICVVKTSRPTSSSASSQAQQGDPRQSVVITAVVHATAGVSTPQNQTHTFTSIGQSLPLVQLSPATVGSAQNPGHFLPTPSPKPHPTSALGQTSGPATTPSAPLIVDPSPTSTIPLDADGVAHRILDVYTTHVYTTHGKSRLGLMAAADALIHDMAANVGRWVERFAFECLGCRFRRT